MKTSNPVFQESTFARPAGYALPGQAMTVNGTIHKTGILLLCVLGTSMWTWNRFYADGIEAVSGLIMVGAIGGLIMALVTTFKKEWAPFTSPVYALLEGLALGGISAITELRFPGIAVQAVMLTFGTCFCMLLLYRTGVVRATDKFKTGIFAATGGIALIYLASFVMGFLGIQIPGIFSNGLIGIGFSLVVVTIAALNLILDFDFIEQGAANGVPKHLEWFAAFGLMVTLIWLYLELLRLLSKLRSRR